jgi:hypothetical protein
MLATAAGLAILLICSAGLGHGLLRVCGREEWSPTSGAVGLAAMILLTALATRLPGHATTAAGVVGLVALATVAGAFAAWRRRPRPRPDRGALVAGAVAFAASCTPFAVNWRIGLPGMSANDDPARHLLAIAHLRSDGSAPDFVLGMGYPQGPHALVAALGRLTGAADDHALTALVMVVPILTALAALSAWEHRAQAGGRAVLAAVLTALAYLPAAWLVQSAFKETLVALFVLAFALELRALARGTTSPAPLAAVPLAVLAAGCVATYSFFGLAWPAATFAAWGLAELTVRAGGTPGRALAVAAGARRVALPALGVLLLLLLVDGPAILALFESVGLSPAASGAITETNLGYVLGQLSPLEALGVWPSGDYRLAPASALATWGAGLVSVAATVYALAWWLRRRDFALPAAVVSAALAYLVVRPGESPYVSAKALVILGVVVAILCLRALLDAGRPAVPLGRRVVTVLAAAFVLGAAGSSVLALRNSQVGTRAHAQELAEIAGHARGRPLLLLTNDEYAYWRLFGAEVTQPGGRVPLRPEKAPREGEPWDFDSVAPESLDAFAFVVTSRVAYASAPPSNFEPALQTDSYVLWRRTGPSPPRRTLAEGAAPGALLDCTGAPGRELAGTEAKAAVIPAPVEAALPATLPAGEEATATLALSPGRWQLALQYRSPRPLPLEAPGLKMSLPSNLDRIGPLWPAATITVAGRPGGAPQPVTVRISMPAEPLPGLRRRVARLGRLAAAAARPSPRHMPMRRACGRYVDWFAPAAG